MKFNMAVALMTYIVTYCEETAAEPLLPPKSAFSRRIRQFLILWDKLQKLYLTYKNELIFVKWFS